MVVLVWATPQVGMYHCTVDIATVTAPICFELHILKPQQPQRFVLMLVSLQD